MTSVPIPKLTSTAELLEPSSPLKFINTKMMITAGTTHFSVHDQYQNMSSHSAFASTRRSEVQQGRLVRLRSSREKAESTFLASIKTYDQSEQFRSLQISISQLPKLSSTS